MAIPYCQWLGLIWKPWQFERWPDDLLEMMRAYGSLRPPRDRTLCMYVDQPCLRLEWQHMCGCIPPGGNYRRVPSYPFYRVDVDDTTGEAFPVLGQQLALWEPPKCYRLNRHTLLPARYRWWVGFFGCEQGMYHYIQREREDGCPNVRVTRIYRPTARGPRARLITQDVSPCWAKVK